MILFCRAYIHAGRGHTQPHGVEVYSVRTVRSKHPHACSTRDPKYPRSTTTESLCCHLWGFRRYVDMVCCIVVRSRFIIHDVANLGMHKFHAELNNVGTWKGCSAQTENQISAKKGLPCVWMGKGPPQPHPHPPPSTPPPSVCRTDSLTSLWRAHPDLNQGPADLQSAALTTELCTHVWIWCQGTSVQGVHSRASFSWLTRRVAKAPAC